jgi:phosphate starvation-inducible PhoH-like protein
MARNKTNLQTQSSQSPQLVVSNKLKIRLDDMKTIEPLTENQKGFFEAYDNSSIMMLLGVAGTGKTYIALYHALEEVLERNSIYDKVVIVRSAVPSREIGHLPGDEKEKTEVYQQPYISICHDLFERSDAYQRLTEQKVIQFMITSFIRGTTLDNSIILVDECQNMTDMELNSIITRVGERSKIIFCGDFRQTDLYKKTDMSGLKKFMAIADMMPSFKIFEFGVEDIVRSEIVKEYIIARLKYENLYEN